MLVSSLQYTDHPDAPGAPWRKLASGRFAMGGNLDPGDLLEVTALLAKRHGQLVKR